MSRWLPAWICVALLVQLLAVGTASARIYQWVDDRGVQHFSDRIEDVPPAFRDQVGFEEELEARSPVNFLDGLNEAFGREAGIEGGEAAEAEGFEANLDDFEAQRMMQQLQGPMVVAAAVAALFVLGIALAFMTLALLTACRMVGQETPGFRKGYAIVLVQFLAGLAAAPGVVVVMGPPEVDSLGSVVRMQAVQMAVSLVVNAIVLRAMLCDSMGRSLALAVVVTLVLLLFGVVLGVGVAFCAGGAALLSAG